MTAFVQVAGKATRDSNGIVTTAISSTAGNAMVALIAANVADTSWQVSSVQDSAGNIWSQIGTVVTPNATQPNQVTLSMWATYNAAAVTSVTATFANMTDYVGVGMLVYEASGVTNLATIDVVTTASSNAATSMTPAATTTAAGFVVAAAAIGDAVNNLVHTADSWIHPAFAFTDGTTSDEDDSVRLQAACLVTASGGAQSTTFTTSPSALPMAGIIAGFKGGATVTANPNFPWPQLSTKAAFGQPPNGTVVYTYSTDITPYVLTHSTAHGSPYELGTTEAGSDQMTLYNADGRFDPTNTASPYSPNVLDYAPVQTLAVWSGVTYGVFTGYVERWPTSFDEALTEMSPAVAVDAYATLARVRMKSCMAHEILMDRPWGYWPLNDASGSPFGANLATGTGQGVYLYPVPPKRAGAATGGFGAATQLAGDPASGWGQANDTPTNDQGWTLGTGVIPSSTFPSVASGGAVTFEVWAMYPLVPRRAHQSCVFALKSSAVSWASRDIVAVTINQNGSAGTAGNVYVDTWDGSGNLTSVDVGAHNYADGRWHLFTVSYTSGAITLFIDGAAVYSGAPAISTAQVDVIDVGGTQDNWESANIGIGSYAHVAAYVGPIPVQRVASHYASGHDGFPEDSGSRINRLLTYAGWKGPRALDTGSTILSGCSTITGQSAVDAINDVQSWEYGLAFVDALGRFRFRNRANRFSQSSKGTFGDGPGELPYDPATGFDNDPTYQYDDVQITRTGPGGVQGVVQYSGDPGAVVQQYFTSTLQQSLQVLSDTQAADRASFLYNLLSVPRTRAQPITIEPSANPALWPVALGIEVGDVYTIKRRPIAAGNTISMLVMIAEVKHEITPVSWKTTLTTLPATTLATNSGVGPWTLDDPVNGVLGTTTAPGF